MSVRSVTGQALQYDTPGNPADVLCLREFQLGEPTGGQVQVRFLQSPINPSDINTVQGKYPLQPKTPNAVPGHEGLAEVMALGPQAQGLAVGDWVVPLQPAMGTWRSHANLDAAHLHAVPKDIGQHAAATLIINPPSALAMLENFVALKAGDSVIQNGATSAVGQAVIQIAKARGIKTVNVIRDRPNWAETVQHLTSLGADLVTTEERLKADLKESGLPAPGLGLNCVGGSAALALAKVLRDSGTLVTYGGMSNQPTPLPASLLIFKDLAFRGFWLSGRWAEQQGPQGRAAALDLLVGMIRDGTLTPPACKSFPLSDWRAAMAAVESGFRGYKVLLAPSSS